MNQILLNLQELDSNEDVFISMKENCEKRIKNLGEFLHDSDKIINPPKNTKNSIQKMSEIHDELSKIRDEFNAIFNSIQSRIENLTEFVKRVTKTNSDMKQLGTKIQEIDRKTNEILDNFIDDINSEINPVVSFANLCAKAISKEKRETLLTQRMEFQKFATKLKDKVEDLR